MGHHWTNRGESFSVTYVDTVLWHGDFAVWICGDFPEGTRESIEIDILATPEPQFERLNFKP